MQNTVKITSIIFTIVFLTTAFILFILNLFKDNSPKSESTSCKDKYTVKVQPTKVDAWHTQYLVTYQDGTQELLCKEVECPFYPVVGDWKCERE